MYVVTISLAKVSVMPNCAFDSINFVGSNFDGIDLDGTNFEGTNFDRIDVNHPLVTGV